jgi:hypothetical protein
MPLVRRQEGLRWAKAQDILITIDFRSPESYYRVKPPGKREIVCPNDVHSQKLSFT